MSPAVAVPFRPTNSVSDKSSIPSHMEITRLKLITNTATLFSEPTPKSSADGDEASSPTSTTGSQVDGVSMPIPEQQHDTEGDGLLFQIVPNNEIGWVANDSLIHKIEENDNLFVGGDIILDTDASCSLSVVTDTGSVYSRECFALDNSSDMLTKTSMGIEKISPELHIISKASGSEEPSLEEKSKQGLIQLATMGVEPKIIDGSDSKQPTSHLHRR